jgi:light-independent protochlorophyllide reductase subunit B
VISAPVHVQDFPARYSPVMGFEGANVLFDTLIHPLVMGLEEHLLTMFREDFEFNDAAGPSHLGHGHANARRAPADRDPRPVPPSRRTPRGAAAWRARRARGGARAAQDPVLRARQGAAQHRGLRGRERGLATISLDTLYDAKAHYAR